MNELHTTFKFIAFVTPFVYFVLSFVIHADKKPDDEIDGIKDNYNYSLWPFSNPELFYEHGKSMLKIGKFLFMLSFISFIGMYLTK